MHTDGNTWFNEYGFELSFNYKSIRKSRKRVESVILTACIDEIKEGLENSPRQIEITDVGEISVLIEYLDGSEDIYYLYNYGNSKMSKHIRSLIGDESIWVFE